MFCLRPFRPGDDQKHERNAFRVDFIYLKKRQNEKLTANAICVHNSVDKKPYS